MKNIHGLFVTLEGTEGAGKSTQVQLLAQRLSEQGCEVVTLREPGGTAIGEEIRHILKHSAGNAGMSPETELLLMNASRAQLVREVIRPALAAGKAVLCDRFFDSTVAYQAFGRCLDAAQVQRIIEFAVGETLPDITLLLKVPIETSEQRRKDRTDSSKMMRDRMEEEDRDFFRRVEQGYDAIASNTGTRVRTIDATLPVEQVTEEIWKWVAPLLTIPITQEDPAWKTVGEYRQDESG